MVMRAVCLTGDLIDRLLVWQASCWDTHRLLEKLLYDHKVGLASSAILITLILPCRKYESALSVSSSYMSFERGYVAAKFT